MIPPAYSWIPPRLGSYGDEAIDLARLAGRELDEEQCYAVDALLSYGRGGRWVALESAVIEPRQNGKTSGVLLPVTLFDLFLLPPDRIVWTAHIFRTARDTFDDFCQCIATAGELSKRVKRISYGHGEEYVELHNGAKLEFLARSKGGGRGLGGKRVVMDEALFIASSAMGALMPVLSARPDPQINYASSAALDTSDHLHRLKTRGREGGDPSLIWLEWCAAGSWLDPPCLLSRACMHTVGTHGCVLDDEDGWKFANHTLNKRISAEYVRSERRTLTPIEFGRERLGWHQDPVGVGHIIDMGKWGKYADPDSEHVGAICFALDCTPERTSAAIGYTGRRRDGARHWQVLHHRPGMSWLVQKAIELDRGYRNVGWAIDPGSPAGSLIPELEQAGLVIHRVNAQEMQQACVSMLNASVDGSGRHLGQKALDQAWRDVSGVDFGESQRFSRRKSIGDITPLMTITLSDYGFRLHEGVSYRLLNSIR